MCLINVEIDFLKIKYPCSINRGFIHNTDVNFQDFSIYHVFCLF